MSHLSLSPCTGSRLQLASSSRHWCLYIEQPQAQPHLLPLTDDNLHPLQKPEICEWAMPRGAITERHKITFQNICIHRFWLVEWTFHAYPECWVPDNFQVTPENSSLPSSLNFSFFFFIKLLTTTKKHLCSLSLTSPCLASFSSEQCLKCCITSTSFYCLPLYNVSLIVFINCKSLWIKASAKWINVNVHKRPISLKYCSQICLNLC